MGAVIFIPLARSNPLLRLQPAPVGRARIRRKNKKFRHRNFSARTYFKNSVGNALAVPIAAKPERRKETYVHSTEHIDKLSKLRQPRVVSSHNRYRSGIHIQRAIKIPHACFCSAPKKRFVRIERHSGRYKKFPPQPLNGVKKFLCVLPYSLLGEKQRIVGKVYILMP